MARFTRRGLLKSVAASALAGLARPAIALTPSQRAIILTSPPFNPVSLFGKYSASGFYYNFAASATRTLGGGLLVPMYQDQAGTVVDADGEAIGLAIDKSQSADIGAEIITNGGFDADSDWTKDAGWTIGSGIATATAIGNKGISQLNIGLVEGAFYRITGECTSYTSGNFAFSLGATGVNGPTINSAGSFSHVIQAAGVSSLDRVRLSGFSAATGSFDNISVKKISGNHGLQTTAAAKPTFKTGAPNYASFDGGDYLNSGLVPAAAGMTVCACYRPTTADADWVSGSRPASSNYCGLIWDGPNDRHAAAWAGQAQDTIFGTTTGHQGNDAVTLLRANGSAVQLWVNGTKEYDAAPSGAMVPSTTMYVGAFNANGTASAQLTGRIHRIIAIQRYVDDADVVPLMQAISAGVVSF